MEQQPPTDWLDSALAQMPTSSQESDWSSYYQTLCLLNTVDDLFCIALHPDRKASSTPSTRASSPLLVRFQQLWKSRKRGLTFAPHRKTVSITMNPLMDYKWSCIVSVWMQSPWSLMENATSSSTVQCDGAPWMPPHWHHRSPLSWHFYLTCRTFMHHHTGQSLTLLWRQQRLVTFSFENRPNRIQRKETKHAASSTFSWTDARLNVDFMKTSLSQVTIAVVRRQFIVGLLVDIDALQTMIFPLL